MGDGEEGGAEGTRQTGENNILTSANEPKKLIEVVKLIELIIA